MRDDRHRLSSALTKTSRGGTLTCVFCRTCMRRQDLLLASQSVSLKSAHARNFYLYEILRSFARLSGLREGRSGITVQLRDLPPAPASSEGAAPGAAAQPG